MFAFAALDIIVPFAGWAVYFMMDHGSPRTLRYHKIENAPALVPFELRNGEKYLFVNKTSLDIPKGGVTYVTYKGLKSFNRRTSGKGKPSRKGKKETTLVKDDMKIENTVLSDALNETLLKMKFVDTTGISMGYKNACYLNATIRKIKFHEIDYAYDVMTAHTQPNYILCAEVEISWELLDNYKQVIYSTHTNRRSDMFVVTISSNVDINKGTAALKEEVRRKTYATVKDNVEYSLLDVRRELRDKGYLKLGGNNIQDTSARDTSIVIVRVPPASGQRLNTFLKSAVTVKVDKGHGSGFVIADEGYIITNYHVVAGTKTVEVIFNDGSKVSAAIIRTSPVADLALLKVDKRGLQPLCINELKAPEGGTEVWAIGTPISLELGQSVAKGVVSGTQLRSDVNYIQTDAKINPGNSGGALINKDGVVQGVVVSSIVGGGTEGINFAIQAVEIFEKLHIQYK